jgi:type II secretory pathway pseudopilin PulG
MSRLRPRSRRIRTESSEYEKRDRRHRVRAWPPRKTGSHFFAPCSSHANEATGDSQAGYALLEFLVAFTILVVVLASLLAALSVSVRSDHQAIFLTRATILAKSKLAAAGQDFPLRPGTSAGSFGNGWEWRAVLRSNGGAPGESQRVDSLWVEVTVSDGRGNGSQSMTLQSIEIVPRRGP